MDLPIDGVLFPRLWAERNFRNALWLLLFFRRRQSEGALWMEEESESLQEENSENQFGL